MVTTKENVPAHAIAEHLVALQLLQDVQELMGRRILRATQCLTG